MEERREGEREGGENQVSKAILRKCNDTSTFAIHNNGSQPGTPRLKICVSMRPLRFIDCQTCLSLSPSPSPSHSEAVGSEREEATSAVG